MVSEKDELLKIIQTKAVIYGSKVLASGKTSHYYIDGKQVSLDARGAFLVGRCLFELMKANRPDAVGGPTLGADPMVGAILAEAGKQGIALQGFIVRKEVKDHGTSKLIEGPSLKPGMRVALVEDVITTGGSVLKAVSAVEGTGAKVVQIVCLVDRDEGARDGLALYNYTPLFSKSQLKIKSPAETGAKSS